ncbi:response regulator transcription factor [Ruminococcus flavefaciens]|uniref:response regulator transcription factor n=1 Tax=Ruminococcus flavefaciens TaxID=1265 RepID=UPI00056C5AD7|nr:response regulator transcription factor [Ruminococcus flavefaciens]
MYKILIIDDDPAIIRLIKNSLSNESYELHTRNSVEDINLCDFMGFDLILLDMVMPNSGIDICKMIRNEIKIPIIFISAKSCEDNIIDCITSGGDDFIAKPFSVKELKARVKMHLRREERYSKKKTSLRVNDRFIELSDLKVVINDSSFFLTKKEYNIIKLLSDNSNRVFSSEEIYDCVYPLSTDTQIRSISEYIYQIRKKFKPFGLDPIFTVWGGGYCWKK